jgi:hypothetical protein
MHYVSRCKITVSLSKYKINCPKTFLFQKIFVLLQLNVTTVVLFHHSRANPGHRGLGISHRKPAGVGGSALLAVEAEQGAEVRTVTTGEGQEAQCGV